MNGAAIKWRAVFADEPIVSFYFYGIYGSLSHVSTVMIISYHIILYYFIYIGIQLIFIREKNMVTFGPS
jgi:hypothetical protein